MRQNDPLGGLRLGLALMTANGICALAGTAVLSGWACSLAAANTAFAARAFQGAIGLAEAAGASVASVSTVKEDNIIVLAERRKQA